MTDLKRLKELAEKATPMEMVKIALAGGRYDLVECAAQVENLAITRSDNGHGWRITHLPTGLAFPYAFASAAVAEECARECVAVADIDFASPPSLSWALSSP